MSSPRAEHRPQEKQRLPSAPAMEATAFATLAADGLISSVSVSEALSHVAIVGAGAVARSFAHALVAADIPPLVIACRSLTSAATLSASLSTAKPPFPSSLAAPPTPHPSALLAVRLIVIAVTDSALPSVAKSLSTLFPSATFAMHTSGALSSSVIAPAAPIVLGLHPAAPFSPGVAPTVLDDVLCALDTDDECGAALGAAFAARLRMSCFRLGTGAHSKAAYHAACCMAGGAAGLAAAAAAEVLRSAVGDGVPRGVSARLIGDLARKAVDAVVAAVAEDRDPVAVLTGPVFRGDASVVRRHAEALKAGCGDDALYVERFYCASARAMAAAAHCCGRIDEQERDRIEEALNVD